MITMVEEKTFNIPLRKEFLKVPKYQRSKKAVKAVKEFLQKHMKSENIKLGTKLNEFVWKDGIRNPPHHVKVNVKVEDTIVYAELVGFEFEKKIEKKKQQPQTLKEKIADKIGAPKPKKKEETKEEKHTEKTEKVTLEKKEEKKSEPVTDKKEEKAPVTTTSKKEE